MKNKAFIILAAALATASIAAAQDGADDFSSRQPATRDEGDCALTPVNQIIEPAGRQVYLPKLRPQAPALSPDGGILVTSGKTHDLIVIDSASARVLQEVLLPMNQMDPTATPMFDCFSNPTMISNLPK